MCLPLVRARIVPETPASFRPCVRCLLSRHAAQFDGPDADACQQPARFPLSHPLTAGETRRHEKTGEEARPTP